MDRREFLRGAAAALALGSLKLKLPGLAAAIDTAFEPEVVPTAITLAMFTDIVRRFMLPSIIENLYRPNILLTHLQRHRVVCTT